MQNLHKIRLNDYTDAQKAYASYWKDSFIVFGPGEDAFSRGPYKNIIYQEHLDAGTIKWLIKIWDSVGRPEPDYSRMSIA